MKEPSSYNSTIVIIIITVSNSSSIVVTAPRLEVKPARYQVCPWLVRQEPKHKFLVGAVWSIIIIIITDTRSFSFFA